MKKNKILLVFTQMQSLGGVQTLIVRIANWLVEHGYTVNLLLFKGGEALDLLDKSIEVMILGEEYDDYFFPTKMKVLSKNEFFSNISFIYSFGAKVLFLSALLIKYLDKKPKIACGIYYPMIFTSPNIFSFNRVFGLLFNKYLSHSNKFFMSKEILNLNQKYFNSDFSSSKVFPLPINNISDKDFNRLPKKYKIISVGRLVSFKTYNNYMIDVIEDLINSGYNVTYDIYGDGPLMNELVEKIKNKSLQKHITLHGKVSYDKLKDIFSDAYIFVGMGTSVLEASFCSVPSVVAQEKINNPLSQGYIYNMPEYNCGEYIQGMKKIKVYDLILDLINKNDKDYNLECKKTYDYVQKYSIDNVMHEFLNLIKYSSDSKQIVKFPKFYFYLYCMRTILKKIFN